MSAARIFLDRLFAPYDRNAGLTCEIRSMVAGSREVEQRWFGLGRLESAATHAEEMAPTHDVYVGVLPRNGRGGHARDVAAAGWLFVDMDSGGDPAGAFDLLKAARIFWPAMVVDTPSGGAHLYWPLLPPSDLSDGDARAAFRKTLRRVVRAIGGAAPGPHADPAATDESRVLRVPGTLYHKTDPPGPVRLLMTSRDRPTPLAEWNLRLPIEPVAPALRIAALADTKRRFPHHGPLQRAQARPGVIPRHRCYERDEDLLTAACRSQKGGERFRRLYAGDTADYGGDESRADLALLEALAFWTDRDAGRMERLFTDSGLGQREKWQQRPDYRRRSIEAAISGRGAT